MNSQKQKGASKIHAFNESGVWRLSPPRSNTASFLRATGTAALSWKYELPGGIAGSSPTVSGKLLYICAEDKRVYALEKASGQLVWSFEAEDITDSTPLIYDESLFVTSSDNTVYRLTNQVVEPSQTTNLFQSTTGAEVTSSKSPLVRTPLE